MPNDVMSEVSNITKNLFHLLTQSIDEAQDMYIPMVNVSLLETIEK